MKAEILPLTNLIPPAQIKSTLATFVCSPVSTHLLVVIAIISAFIRYPQVLRFRIQLQNAYAC